MPNVCGVQIKVAQIEDTVFLSVMFSPADMGDACALYDALHEQLRRAESSGIVPVSSPHSPMVNGGENLGEILKTIIKNSI